MEYLLDNQDLRFAPLRFIKSFRPSSHCAESILIVMADAGLAGSSHLGWLRSMNAL